MKKITAILFLSVLSFNWFGYRFVFDYIEKKHDQRIEAQLDENNYNEDELISLKAPFPVPYFVSTNKFERWNGEIEIDGTQYKYVKRRFYNDSIEVLCIPNNTANELQAARHDFFRNVNDLTANGQNKKQEKLPVFKNLLSEFCEKTIIYNFSLPDKINGYYSFYKFFVPEVLTGSKDQPPEFS